MRLALSRQKKMAPRGGFTVETNIAGLGQQWQTWEKGWSEGGGERERARVDAGALLFFPSFFFTGRASGLEVLSGGSRCGEEG